MIYEGDILEIRKYSTGFLHNGIRFIERVVKIWRPTGSRVQMGGHIDTHTNTHRETHTDTHTHTSSDFNSQFFFF
jgi:hypothetical protein